DSCRGRHRRPGSRRSHQAVSGSQSAEVRRAMAGSAEGPAGQAEPPRLQRAPRPGRARRCRRRPGMSVRRALVCALMPEYDRDSGSRRVLHLIEFLQKTGWKITFVSHHANPRPRYVHAFEARGIEVYSGSSKWMEPLIATGHYDLAVLGLWDIAEA